MTKDTHLKGQEYSWGEESLTLMGSTSADHTLRAVGSIFYFGWLVAEYPMNVVLQKLPVGKSLSAAVLIWGAMVMCLAAAKNAPGLMVMRFILGALEAIEFPAVTVLNTMWYKKSEQPIRMALTFTAFSSVSSDIQTSSYFLRESARLANLPTASHRCIVVWYRAYSYSNCLLETIIPGFGCDYYRLGRDTPSVFTGLSFKGKLFEGQGKVHSLGPCQG